MDLSTIVGVVGQGLLILGAGIVGIAIGAITLFIVDKHILSVRMAPHQANSIKGVVLVIGVLFSMLTVYLAFTQAKPSYISSLKDDEKVCADKQDLDCYEIRKKLNALGADDRTWEPLRK